jgi:D-alanyl-D-alanine carboxypeptidase
MHHLAPPSDYDLYNGNSLLDAYPGADGVKIGWTDYAGWTFVASASRDGHRLIVAVLDTQDRDADATALLDWAWQTHRWVTLGPNVDGVMRVAQRFRFTAPFSRTLGVCE